jgi:hypothetical protein
MSQPVEKYITKSYICRVFAKSSDKIEKKSAKIGVKSSRLGAGGSGF